MFNLESFNDYGQFAVNDTISIGTNSSSTVNSVTFGYPASYNGHVYSISALLNKGSPLQSSDVSSSVTNQTLEMKVSLPNPLSPQSPGNVSLRFYVSGIYAPQNSSSSGCTTCYYGVPLLLFPSTSISPTSNIPVNNIESNITFPDPSVTIPSTNSTGAGSAVAKSGFGSQTTSSFFRLYNSTTITAQTASFLNTVHWANASIGSSSTNAGIVDFLNVQRTFSVSLSGNLIVTDSYLVRNLGPNTISSLNLGVLTGSNSSSVTIEPSGQTLLSNAQTVSATNGQIDVLSATGNTIEPNATLQMVVQYPLGAQYWNYSGGTYYAHIPTALPVNALVNQFQTSYSIPSGFVTIQSPPSLDLTNTSGQAGTASLTYRKGVGFAYGFILPISAIVFLGVFIAALVFKPRGEKKKEEIETTLTSLIRAAEDKVSGTNEILSELKAKSTSATKTDLSTARIRIEELRSRSVGRFGTIRTELGATNTSAQVALAQAATDDREFDRAVRDLLSIYDQLISKRMKPDSFAKAQQNNERRIQRITNMLLDGLQDLRRDYEQEQ